MPTNAQLQAQITTLQHQVATLQSQVASLQSRQAGDEQQLAALSAQVATLETQVQQLATLPGSLANLDARVTALEKQVAYLTSLITVNPPTPIPPPILALTCPPAQTANSSDGNPVNVTYPAAAASSGTPPYSAISYDHPSGSSFPVGTTTVHASVTDSSSPVQTATCSFPVTVNAVVATNLLTPADFTYLGAVTVPVAGEGGTNFTFTAARLSGRVVGGNIHLFLSQIAANASPGPPVNNDAVAELLYNGIGNPCTLVTNWGDITKNNRPTLIANAQVMGGLYWDPVNSLLYWTYGPVYSGNTVYNPTLGASSLTGSDNSGVTAYGPWRLGPDTTQKTRGYMYPLSGSIQSALGGKRVAVGAPSTPGNSTSPFGAYAAAFVPPTTSTPPSVLNDITSVAAVCTDLIFTDINNPQARPPDTYRCGWVHYGESDSLGAQPQNNPTQDGSGCTVNGQLCGATLQGPLTTWTTLDALTCAAAIYGPNKSGIVYIGAVGRTLPGFVYEGNGFVHVTYGPNQSPGTALCVHGQNGAAYNGSTGDETKTMMSALYIYDPGDLLLVAQGLKSATDLAPKTDCYDMSLLAHSGSAFPQVAFSQTVYGGAWYEPVSKLLFVSSYPQPVIHVFSVNA